MAEANLPGGRRYPLDEVLAFEQELGKVLLEWSWEGTMHYEEILEKVATAYGCADTVAIVGSKSVVVEIAGRHVITKCGIPELPPLAVVPNLKALIEDVYAGALSPAEAGNRLRKIREAPPVYPLALRFFGGILLAVAFAVDLVGTWEGIVAAIVTALVTTPIFALSPALRTCTCSSMISKG